MELSDRPRVAWDTSATIYYLERAEPFYGSLAEQFGRLQRVGGSLVLSVVVYHELLVGPWKQQDWEAVGRVVLFCRRRPVELADLTPTVIRRSAPLRATTGLATPDSLIIATAQAQRCAEIVGNDRQWRRHALGIPFRFLGEGSSP